MLVMFHSFNSYTILRATHFTETYFVLVLLLLVMWFEEKKGDQGKKSRAFSYFACVDVLWRQSGRSGWYGLQVLTCDAHTNDDGGGCTFCSRHENRLRFFEMCSCLEKIYLWNIFKWNKKPKNKEKTKKFQFQFGISFSYWEKFLIYDKWFNY